MSGRGLKRTGWGGPRWAPQVQLVGRVLMNRKVLVTRRARFSLTRVEAGHGVGCCTPGLAQIRDFRNQHTLLDTVRGRRRIAPPGEPTSQAVHGHL